MFTDNKNSKSNLNSFSQQNTIAQGTTFNGDLTSEGDFRVEGAITVTLQSRRKFQRIYAKICHSNPLHTHDPIG